jgi:hypothetical protein
MALLPCRECGKPVSDEAPICPSCGAPRPYSAEWTGTGVDWKSRATVFGLPLIHVAFGRNAQGKRRVAIGIIAIGQFALGIITIAQFGVGLLFGFGQFIAGFTAVAQFALAAAFGVGQFAVGYFAIGQAVLGVYGLGQVGWAKYLWTPKHLDAEALAMFRTIYDKALSLVERIFR